MHVCRRFLHHRHVYLQLVCGDAYDVCWLFRVLGLITSMDNILYNESAAAAAANKPTKQENIQEA